MQQRPLARLLQHTRHHRKRVILASLCSITNKVFDLAPPALIGAAIDVVVKREASFVASFGVSSVMAQLWVLAAITVAVWVAESVFEYAYNLLWRNLAQAVQHELRMEAWDHVQSLEMAYFEDRQTGTLLSILNDDVNQLERFLNDGANQLYQVGTTVIVVGFVFFTFSWQLALIAFLPVPFVLLGSIRFQDYLAPKYAAVRTRVGELSARLTNALGGIATIKSFTAEEQESERIRKVSLEYQEANREAIRLSSAFVPLIRMVILVGFTATMVYGGWLVEGGALAVGAYSVLVFLTQRLLWPLTRLGETLDLYQRAMASTQRILDLLDTPAAILSGEVSLPRDQVVGRIRFDGLGFSYANAPVPALHTVDFGVEPGETIGIVGSTGSGKSTLMKLLLRFHDPTQGQVTLDGHPLTTLKLYDLRRAIGLVSQDVFLFHGTVRENVMLGREAASEDEIWQALAVAEAEDFVRALPEGLDTIIGERGQKLSGGQRQRLSIARAVLKDPPILVLDEATSAVDNETEAAIQRSMSRITKGRTTLVIAHRLSTVREAHRIFVLDNGNIVEVGTHRELIGLGGVYARLWAVQAGEVQAALEGAPR